jgi:hypothetical protein
MPAMPALFRGWPLSFASFPAPVAQRLRKICSGTGLFL